MKEKRYNVLVTICVWMLRSAMLVLAMALPAVFYVHSFILNGMIGKDMLHPQFYFAYQILYNEVFLGILLAMFLNFHEKKIFVKENAVCLKLLGYAIICKDLIYGLLSVCIQAFSINFNLFAWMVGLIMINFSKLILHGIKLKDEQEYTV